jgi:transketolase
MPLGALPKAQETETPLAYPVTAALRALAMDAIEAAKSGHPGAPLGMAEIAAVLWRKVMRHDPADPAWPDRDRFVLSNGHASMLLYSVLHLTGYDLPMEELKRFRQLHSKTPGHPEYGRTPGVETTTGPLGQGFANAVGMALAERTLAAQFNRPGHEIVNHRTFVFMGDGCMMEGISHEAASLAGRLGLGKLIAYWDDNGISIDGKLHEWFADDTPARFRAYGWHVVADVDGHDMEAVAAATALALAATNRPSLICCRTTIGRGAPTMQGHHDTHGAPLGAEEVARARAVLDWPHEAFHVPEEVYAEWDGRARGKALSADWRRRFIAYSTAYPELAAEFTRRLAGDLPKDFEAAIATALENGVAAGPVATRKASQIALSAFAAAMPEMIGGSADLAHSNMTVHAGSRPVTRDSAGNQVFFGVRELGMAAIANGLALHGGFAPFVGTFLMFSDYARAGIRMSALMGLRVIYVFTHDSIYVGEDGPTHQPIEQVESLRLIPNLAVWRPADAVETAHAWRAALERRDGPTALILTRQALPAIAWDGESETLMAAGARVLSDPPGAKATLIATGSEVTVATDAAARLAAEGRHVRVVSMPCAGRFKALPPDVQAALAPADLPVGVIEAGVTSGWRSLAGPNGFVIGIDQFGESAPAAKLQTYFGLTPEQVADVVRNKL